MLRKFFLYLLVTTVFISGNGVVLAIHTCFTSSTKTVSLFENQSCGGKHSEPCHDENSCEVKGKCCLLQYNYYKLDLTSSTKKFDIVAWIAPKLVSSNVLLPKFENNYFIPAQALPFTKDIPIVFSQLLI